MGDENDYVRIARDIAVATQRLLGAVRHAVRPGESDCTPMHTVELLTAVVELERVRRWADGLGRSVLAMGAREE